LSISGEALSASRPATSSIERENEPRFHFLVGQSEIPFTLRIVSDSATLDVATLTLTRDEASEIEKLGYPIVQPPSWPPPDVNPGADVIAAGFPARGRSSIELDLSVETVRAFVRWAGEGQLTTYLDREYTFRNIVDVSAPERPPAFGGFSGGPAFVIPADGLLVVPHLCGIVKEGGVSSLAPGRIVLHYAPIHRLQRNGEME